MAVPLRDDQRRDPTQAGEGEELLGRRGLGHLGSFAAVP